VWHWRVFASYERAGDTLIVIESMKMGITVISSSPAEKYCRRPLLFIGGTRMLFAGIAVSAVLFGILCGSSALAQGYPNKSVRFIVPFPPGGANDIIARLLGAKLTELMGKSFVIDNRGGANSIIGCELTAKATPDGYTVLIVPGGHAINPSIYKKLPYDTLRDFSPVSLIGSGAYVLVTNLDLPVRTSADLISLAKSKPNEIDFGSAGIGNITHLAGELFNLMAGTRLGHVPYKGGGPAVTDLLAGRISVYFSTVALAASYVRAGRLKAIGVTTGKRVSILPNLPTIAESGLPGYEVNGWYGLLAPARTPASIIGRLNAEVRQAVQSPEVKDKLSALGVEAVGSSSAEFEQLIKADVVKWRKVIRQLNITVE